MTRAIRPAVLFLILTALLLAGAAVLPASASAAPVKVIGTVEKLTVSGTRVSLSGWTADQNNRGKPVQARIYIDGKYRGTLPTNIVRPDIATKYKTASRVGFATTLSSLPYGGHSVCVSSATTPSVRLHCTPVNIVKATAPGKKVAALAAKQVGKRFIDGGAGPSAFDCSGLVAWVYKNALGKTLVHNAQTQANTFRKIPASRAVAGDLVFFHDSSGHVFHVGIVAKAGWMYAAATVREGVRYQTIWSSAVTYGTILHS